MQDLPALAQTIRRQILTMLHQAGSGHPGGSLGMVEVFASLYFGLIHHDPEKPDWLKRDYVFLSAGHICPVWYATLAQAGYFSPDELLTLRQFGSRLQGHPEFQPHHHLPGIENPSGPLGQGLSQAIGLVLGLQLDRRPNRVYCILSDGEQAEGQTMEAYLYAGAHRLSQLTVLIDANGTQLSGPIAQILPQGNLAQRIRHFGWQVLEIDGHNFAAIHQAVTIAQHTPQKPTAIICHTTTGKGVSFMEGKFEWHGKPLSDADYQQAVTEL